MFTEDQFADQMRAAFADVQPREDLLTVLRIRQARRAWATRAAIVAAPVAAAGAAATLILAAGGPAGSPDRSSPAAGGGTPSHASLRTAILTAFDSAQGDILYVRETTTTRGGPPQPSSEAWYSPAQPRPGQRETMRLLTRDRHGARSQDVGLAYIVPPRGAGDVKAADIDVEYGNRTWSEVKHQKLAVKPASAVSSPAAIRAQIAAGNWSVIGKPVLGGRRTIELAWRGASDGPGTTSRLWVDADTYLPVRKAFSAPVGSPGKMRRSTIVDAYSYLARTAANVAKLRVPIPSGFTRTAAQVLPPSPGGGKG